MSPSQQKNDDYRGGRGLRIAFLVLSTVGACLAADLIRLHVKVHTDADYHAYCAVSERLDCGAVALSKYAVALGLPVAVWGLLAYVLMGALAAWGLRGKLRNATWPFGILFGLSVVATGAGVVLFGISHFVIHSVCIVCAGSWVVSIALLVVSALELRRTGTGPLRALVSELASIRARPRQPLQLAAALGVVVVALWIAVPAYWRVDPGLGPGAHASGFTPEGLPWMGAEQPTLEITEFSDYQCPYCQRGHEQMRKLVDAYPDRVRLVHRSFPLDQACNPIVHRRFHPYSCLYARMAHCAGEQGRFWEANDFLFAKGRRERPVTSKELAGAVRIDLDQLERCVSGPAAAAALRADLMAGQELRIHGTPVFLIGDQTYPGRIPDDVLQAMLERPATVHEASASRPSSEEASRPAERGGD